MAELLIVVGARPNFMKAASVVTAAEERGIEYTLVHTGQHYDHALSRVFFDELELPPPHVYLGIGSGSHTRQTARIMLAFEPELRRIDPAVVVVVGDVNSTLACSLVAAKEHYPVAHVEAGLRSYDERMPEEMNRRLCDAMSTYLFTTSRDAGDNLLREGVPPERIFFAGNTMIDTLLAFRDAARRRDVPARFGLEARQYGVVTLHRPENVDDPDTLSGIVFALEEISRHLPLVFPVHPRTFDRLDHAGLRGRLERAPALLTAEPLGYLDFLGLLGDARLVLTDSGGIQEEATVLGVPCLTMRDTTERPVTVDVGSNTVVGTAPRAIRAAARAELDGAGTLVRLPELWDGHAGERIVDELAASLHRTVRHGVPVPA